MKQKEKPLTLGERIKIARTESGLSQQNLADYLKLSNKAISTYEVGRAQPTFETVQKICMITNKPISFFDVLSDNEESDMLTKLDKIEAELRIIRLQLENKSQSD